MMRRATKLIAGALALCLAVAPMAACKQEEQKTADFSQTRAIAELATLDCYYHNVASVEREADGWLPFINTGYKKIWFEYTGTVTLGVDVNKVAIELDDETDKVTVTLPDATVQEINVSIESMSDPVYETGAFTEVTIEDKTEAFKNAQETMRNAADTNESLKYQARERAKSLLEQYINSIAEINGTSYKIEWVYPK